MFLRWGVVSTSPKFQAGGPPLVGCPRLLIQYICSYPPYWRPFLHLQPPQVACRGDRDPLTMELKIPDKIILPLKWVSYIGMWEVLISVWWNMKYVDGQEIAGTWNKVACFNIYLCDSDIDRLMETHRNYTGMDNDPNWRSSVSSNFDAVVLFTHLSLHIEFGCSAQFIIQKHCMR